MNDVIGRTKETSRKVWSAAALVWLLATIVIGLQSWLGDQTIYSRALEEKREAFHFAILANEAPGGAGWGQGVFSGILGVDCACESAVS